MRELYAPKGTCLLPGQGRRARPEVSCSSSWVKHPPSGGVENAFKSLFPKRISPAETIRRWGSFTLSQRLSPSRDQSAPCRAAPLTPLPCRSRGTRPLPAVSAGESLRWDTRERRASLVEEMPCTRQYSSLTDARTQRRYLPQALAFRPERRKRRAERKELFQAAPRGRAKASRHRPCPRSRLGPQGNGRFLGAETDAWRCIRTAALREDLTGAAPEAGTRRRPRGALGPTRPV